MEQKGIYPSKLRAPVADTMCCSAMPHSMYWAGSSSATNLVMTEPLRSAVRAITCGLSFARSSNAWP